MTNCQLLGKQAIGVFSHQVHSSKNYRICSPPHLMDKNLNGPKFDLDRNNREEYIKKWGAGDIGSTGLIQGQFIDLRHKYPLFCFKQAEVSINVNHQCYWMPLKYPWGSAQTDFLPANCPPKIINRVLLPFICGKCVVWGEKTKVSLLTKVRMLTPHHLCSFNSLPAPRLLEYCRCLRILSGSEPKQRKRPVHLLPYKKRMRVFLARQGQNPLTTG